MSVVISDPFFEALSKILYSIFSRLFQNVFLHDERVTNNIAVTVYFVVMAVISLNRFVFKEIVVNESILRTRCWSNISR